MAEMSDDKVFTTEFSLDWAEKGNLAALPGFTIKSLRTLAAEVRRLQAALTKEDAAHEQTCKERDAAEQALSQAYFLIVGHSPEWSNNFGHQHALEAIDDAQRTMRQTIGGLQAENARLRPEAEKPSPPRRAVEIDLHVGANNWADAVRELVETAAHIEDHGPQCSSVAGSPSSNHIVTVYQDPTMTHERYFEALDRYLAAREAAEKGVGR